MCGKLTMRQNKKEKKIEYDLIFVWDTRGNNLKKDGKKQLNDTYKLFCH